MFAELVPVVVQTLVSYVRTYDYITTVLLIELIHSHTEL